MNLLILTHPAWVQSSSMPRFAGMIQAGMRRRGHCAELVTAPPLFSSCKVPSASIRKWAGYVDQFALFPHTLRRRIKFSPADTLVVVSDQALGPWVPAITQRPHVIHCHDFLAQRSALNEFPENPVSWTGKQYQSLIRRGYRRGKHFISVSHQTHQDLLRFLEYQPSTGEVVHNGLNGNFCVIEPEKSRQSLGDVYRIEDRQGFLLHVGGNQWYKNRQGVIELYQAWCERTSKAMPLWMIGSPPTESLREAAQCIGSRGEVRFLTGLSNEQVIAAYNLASLFLYPSLEEGFGWPIAEAMACGTPVLTTSAAPMTEVGGDAAIYHRRRTAEDKFWSADGANLVDTALNWAPSQRSEVIDKCLRQAALFDHEIALNRYEQIYRDVLASHGFYSDNAK